LSLLKTSQIRAREIDAAGALFQYVERGDRRGYFNACLGRLVAGGVFKRLLGVFEDDA
jgi:hypothetical protein